MKNPATYKGIYAMHKYWSKKPPTSVASFIQRFSQEGDIVLDPFSGYGVTGIEAVRLNRKAVLVDLNPVATFLSTVIVTPVSIQKIEKTFDDLKRTVTPVLDSLYHTQCPVCSNKNAIATHYIHEHDTIRTVWAQCPQCKTRRGEKPPSEEDLCTKSYEDIPFWYPRMTLFENSRINSKKTMDTRNFFTARNLYALSFLYSEIEKIENPLVRNFFTFVMTASIPQMSNMVFVVKTRGKTASSERYSKREEVGSWVVGYWIPDEHFEINVWKCFHTRYRKALRGKREAATILSDVRIGSSFADLKNVPLFIKTADATNLCFIPDKSIDYIFTDPPHGDRIPYFELSILWASWLKMDMDFEKEIVVSNAIEREKDITDYRKRLVSAFEEIYRVLKDGKCISVAFNNLDDETWLSFVDILACSGFEIIDIYPMHYSAGSVVQDTRKGGLKSDFIFTCRKGQPRSLNHDSFVDRKDIHQYVYAAKNGKKHEKGIYEVLNVVIPELIRKRKFFKISEILEACKELMANK